MIWTPTAFRIGWLWLFLCLGGVARAESPKQVVAVLDIRNRQTSLSTEAIQGLDDYLVAKLTSSDRFLVVPREKLKTKLNKIKTASYRDNYSREFQVELGQELAAQKTLVAQILEVGQGCVLTATLFDMREAVAERAATAQGPCTAKGMSAAVDSVVDQLTGNASTEASKVLAGLTTKKELALKVWTNRGEDGVYQKGEKLVVFLAANRDCHVRLIYHQADGTNVQIFPNALHGDSRIKGGMVWAVPREDDAFELEVSPPFGAESITAYASTQPFAKLEGKTNGQGLTVLDGDLDRITTETRGIKIKAANAEYTEAGVKIRTAGN